MSTTGMDAQNFMRIQTPNIKNKNLINSYSDMNFIRIDRNPLDFVLVSTFNVTFEFIS